MAERRIIRRPGRYVLLVDGEPAGHADYVDHPGAREFHHTVVLPAYRGRGLSRPLIRAALEDCRAEGLGIIPTCGAVARVVEGDAGYRRLRVRGAGPGAVGPGDQIT